LPSKNFDQGGTTYTLEGNFLVVMEKITPDYIIISCFHIDDTRNQKYYEDKYTKRVK
jgi:hypothetical protein